MALTPDAIQQQACHVDKTMSYTNTDMPTG